MFLEGSVQREGGQIQINAQLIDADHRRPSLGRSLPTARAGTAGAAERGDRPPRPDLNRELIGAAGRRIEQDTPRDPDAQDYTMRGMGPFTIGRIREKTNRRRDASFERAPRDRRALERTHGGLAQVLVGNIFRGVEYFPERTKRARKP